jgi:hypothetical protein
MAGDQGRCEGECECGLARQYTNQLSPPLLPPPPFLAKILILIALTLEGVSVND